MTPKWKGWCVLGLQAQNSMWSWESEEIMWRKKKKARLNSSKTCCNSSCEIQAVHTAEWIALWGCLCLCIANRWSAGNCADKMISFWVAFVRWDTFQLWMNRYEGENSCGWAAVQRERSQNYGGSQTHDKSNVVFCRWNGSYSGSY